MNIDKGIALGKDSTGMETIHFPQSEHTKFSALSPVEKRKMLRRMEKTIPLNKMTYEQAKLYHRLRGRIT